MLQSYRTSEDAIELGLDEAGRGCLMGPVCIAGVILNSRILKDNPPPYKIRDSKKCSVKQRLALRQYILENASAYSIQFMSEEDIDQYNILQATMKGMHKCIDDIRSKGIEPSLLLVDGTYFPYYMNEDMENIPHECVQGGDNLYINIAAASILAKTSRDQYMKDLVSSNPELEKYGIHTNKGYGTKVHMEALRTFGPTKYHRKSFKPCQ